MNNNNMKLAPTQFSTKVLNTFYATTLATLLVSVVTRTPLVKNPWLQPLADNSTAMAVITLVGAVTGYRTEERAIKP